MLKVLDTTTETEETPATPTLDDLAREGARRMLMAALQVEVAQYVDAYQEARDASGRRLVVRHGQAEARKVTCGAGTVEVRAPRVNDKRVDATGQRERFTSRILPPYMRRSPKVAEVLPILYLRGLSTGDFREALPVLLGNDAAGLSATNIARLTAVWEDEYRQFRQRDLADRDYVYVWVDGIHFNIRLEDEPPVHAGGHRRARRRDEGARRARGRVPRKCRELGGAVARAAAPRARGARGRGWRWGPGVLERRPGRVASDGRATRLVPQAGKCPGQAPETSPAQGQARAARHPGGGDARAGRGTSRHLRRGVRGEVSESGRVPGDRPGGAPDLLRLSGQTLDSSPDHETSSNRRSPRSACGNGSPRGQALGTKGLLMAYKLLDMAQRRWWRLNAAHLLPLVRAGVVFIDGVQQEPNTEEDRKEAA